MKLRNTYVESGLTLGLGAGVSYGCGLPSWPVLLERIAEALLSPPPVERLRQQGMSLPALATLLRNDEKPMAFARRVRKALYYDFPFFPDGWKHRKEEFVRFVGEKNPTLRAVAALCAGPSKTGKDRQPNPRIHALVTFNIDALLQTYISARYGTRFVRTIERATASPKLGRINLYHVHGHLRFDRKWKDRTKNAPDALVLGEYEYFDVFDNPTGVFTYSFLHLLREHSFLFIGLSMQDDNLRRLLHYSRRELKAAYEAEGVEAKPSKLNRHFAILKRPSESAVADALQQSLRWLGVNPLWVKDFSEIPDLLQALYEAGGDRWNAVW